MKNKIQIEFLVPDDGYYYTTNVRVDIDLERDKLLDFIYNKKYDFRNFIVDGEEMDMNMDCPHCY